MKYRKCRYNRHFYYIVLQYSTGSFLRGYICSSSYWTHWPHGRQAVPYRFFIIRSAAFRYLFFGFSLSLAWLPVHPLPIGFSITVLRFFMILSWFWAFDEHWRFWLSAFLVHFSGRALRPGSTFQPRHTLILPRKHALISNFFTPLGVISPEKRKTCMNFEISSWRGLPYRL